MKSEIPFWKTKTLGEMSKEEWESLCDGCGLCCLLKYKDDDMDDVIYTNIGCRLLDDETCRCSQYEDRHKHVPECVQMRPDTIPEWMPDSCAYKLLDQGRDLPDWHPLVTGDPNTVHEEGISVQGKVISEAFISVEDIESQVRDSIVDGLASGEMTHPKIDAKSPEQDA